MRILFYQGFTSSLRSQGLKFLFILTTFLLSTSLLTANFSARHPLTIALDVGFTSLRLVLLLMALFWIQELISRDIERKNLYFVLAYPITRSQYLLARFFSAALLMLLTLLVVGGLLWLVIYGFDTGYKQPTPPALDGRFALVLLGIWLDLLVVMAFVTLLACLSTTPFLPILVGLGFALAARGLGPTFDYLRHNPHADPEQAALLTPILDAVQFVLPDLSRLDWRVWVLYDQPVQWIDVLNSSLMALAYTGLALVLASRVLEKRDLV